MLRECERAYLELDPAKILDIDTALFPGGLAIWGAVPPIFDTTDLIEDTGIHVHARQTPGGTKIIDDTFPAVAMKYRRDLLETARAVISRETAVSFYLSRFVGNDVTCVFCTYCREPHLDAGWFAVKPHKTHLCHSCGRFFSVDFKGVSNPIARLRVEVEPNVVDQNPVPSRRQLDIQQRDYPGGLQIWASNPAVFWMAERPEESGIHLHAYSAEGERVIDDTYGSVIIDGHALPVQQVAYLMAQSNVGYLDGRIVVASCQECGVPAFDTGLNAFSPHANRHCSVCNGPVRAKGKFRKVVSNPLVGVLDRLPSRLLVRSNWAASKRSTHFLPSSIVGGRIELLTL
jgi:hypothetical protein